MKGTNEIHLCMLEISEMVRLWVEAKFKDAPKLDIIDISVKRDPCGPPGLVIKLMEKI